MTKRVTKKTEREAARRTTLKTRYKDEDFIMLPTVDFCFKELMQNAKIRKGIIAVDALFQCEEPEGDRRDGKSGRIYGRSLSGTGSPQCR